jgi:ketosteroid isomerase-like protein
MARISIEPPVDVSKRSHPGSDRRQAPTPILIRDDNDHGWGCPARSRRPRYVDCVPQAELVLRSAYRAFNARDIEAAIQLMHPEVDWPNAWEDGRVVGRAAVRDYWNRQFGAISSEVEPEGFTEEADGSVTVDVRQVVHDAGTGELISDSHVRHRYRLVDGLVVHMDVLEQPDQQ